MNVCNSTDLPELEIISLLEEQLPVYRLRADTIFGYEHDDWLHTPLVPPDSALDLTTEQIEETLKYFLLCADRVGQMTKTYSDIDAVTRLLEEKERDLELAARIGQSLLKKNKTLSERNELLEEQVEHIREEVSQLRHDLSMKDELLQFYTSAAEESEGESTTSTPVRPSDTSVSVPSFFPLDSLHKKLKDLEEENLSLRSEASHLETETISYEEKEQQLVNDCVKELRDANLQMSTLAEELARKTEDASRQQEEITHLLSQIVDLQKKSKSYAVENEELTQHLGAAKDAQRQLTAELRELEDKYAECMEMLHEAQEELKNLRNKTLPLSTPRRFHSLGLFPMDSLAAEIEGTMRKELQMDDPDVEEQKLHPKRVFQTVKNLNLMRQQRLSLGPSPLNIPGSNQTSCFTSGRSSRVGTPRSNSMYGSESGSGVILDNKTGSILETPDDGSEDSNRRPAGTPGTPGSRDLEAALRRLSLRRDNYLCERRFFEEERERKLAYLAKEDEKVGEDGGGSEGGPGTPTESLLSLCTHPSFGSIWSGYSITTRSYLPEKLQIVKPLEGDYSIQRQSSENEKENLQNPQNNLSALAQNPSQSKNQIGPQLQQNPNCSCDSQDPSAGHKHMFLNSSQTQNQQQQIPNPSQMVEFAYQNPHRVHGGCRLVVLSGLSPPQPQLRAPLALVASLLELLEQQGGGSATLHAWQQLAQPHLGGLLDPRPGVVTKGFRTLDHDQEDQDEGSWHLDQPEEDELSPQSFAGGCVSSSPSSSPGRQRKHHIEDADEGEDSLLEMLRGARRNARAARRVQEGLAVDRPPVSPIPPFPPSSPAKANGQVELRELQGLQAEAVDAVPAFPPVVFPGKCMARTSSTYTFTTCRILHPSDQLTSVSSSPMSASCQISTVLSGSASPLPFSDPATPSYTPCCTPRRLSLSRAESSTNLRDSTCTTSTSVGLVRLLLERGISASVYDPLSRDHGGGGSLTETNGGEAGRHEDPPVAALPSTPPNSPIPRRRCQSASSPSAPPSFRFGPSCDELPYSETFLASRPACVILREVLGEAEKDCGEDGATDGEVANLRLVDKLKRFRTLSARGGATSSAALLAPFGPSGLGTGGLPVLNAGLRRNRSYPAMVGASMAMKDPGGPPSTDIDINILIPHTLQTHHAGMHIHTTHTLHTKDAHAPQQTLTPHTAEHFSQPGDGQSLSRQSSYYHNDGTVKRKEDLKN